MGDEGRALRGRSAYFHPYGPLESDVDRSGKLGDIVPTLIA